MTINWTTEEQEQIDKQSLRELKPSYYYYSTKSLIQISGDMEGYLILQDQEQKQKLLTWIKDVNKIELDNKDRDSLLATYLEIRKTDTEDRLSEMDEFLNQYAELQSDLITDGNDSSRYASITDLNIMLRSISRSVEMVTVQRDQAFHEQNLVTILADILEANKVDDDTEKELKSWQAVISSYKGQSGKSGSKKVGASKLGSVF